DLEPAAAAATAACRTNSRIYRSCEEMAWCRSSVENSLTPVVVCAFTGPAPPPGIAPACGASSASQLLPAEAPLMSPGEVLSGGVVMTHPNSTGCFPAMAPAGAMPLPCLAAELPHPSMTVDHQTLHASEWQYMDPFMFGMGPGMGPCCQPALPALPDMQPGLPGPGPAGMQLAQAVQAANAAAAPFGSGSMPLAAQQVSPGLWCVVVADPSYGGMPAQASVITETCQGPLHSEHLATRSTLNLCLSEHLAPIPEAAAAAAAECDRSSTSPPGWTSVVLQKPEADVPSTPPPRQRSDEMIPTPSPVRRSPQPCLAPSAKGCFPNKPKVASEQRKLHLQPDCMQPGPWHDVHFSTNGHEDGHESHPPQFRGKMHAAASGHNHSTAHTVHKGQNGSNQPFKKRYSQWPSAGHVAPTSMPHHALNKGDSLDSILEHAIWDLMEQVLTQRPKLEEGKRVKVTLSNWLSLLPASRGNMCQRRALANRALRTMSKRLPGCCWTVDVERQEMQVHLADVARFSSFCDGKC
ncbi:unnamed protein product, partial [Symbiodinium necroappetens]